ncbi:MAG: hypothetical protein EPGJADBJ_00291 [Saprospiraceae bacterium]|nr:hypothetical protein [Saprospiraceae bacterium]
MSLNRILVFAFLILSSRLYAQVVSIAQARVSPPGTTITVRGVVTNGNELGKIRYLQDGTAGIAAFPGTGSAPGFDIAVQAGDSIEVTGPTVLFNGLLEVNPVTSWQIISSGHLLPAPKPISPGAVSDALESQLVSVECATFDAAGGVFNNGGTYDIVDGEGNSIGVYLRSGHPMQNSAIPGGPVLLTAILSKYIDYQLLPRSTADFSAASCLYFSEKPEQSDIQTEGFTVSWKTNLPASATVQYGGTVTPANVINLPAPSLAHEYSLTGLTPGQVYWVQIEAAHNGDTILSEIVPFATQSLSSGQIKLYFNHPIDESSSGGLMPEGQSFAEVLDETLARIEAAQQTIDVAMYNNNRDDIVHALEQARARGVRVRYIAALDAFNGALDPAPSFQVLYGNELALMHNKFMVTDAGLTDHCWVMSGSLNWTTGNMTQDFNNTLFIQDQSLARAYELEFEEMWGGNGAFPDPANSRFGAAKKDNTPHRFVIGAIPVESYFSPSDRTTKQIVEAIGTADSEALFALFSYTKDDQTAALLEVMDNGAQVRGLIENIGDPGAEFDYLLSQGVNVEAHTADGDLHHKYAVVDAGTPGSAPLIVTGSHNWTLAAETANDENTLIIRDAGIARLFKAEFERRWLENTVSTTSPFSQQIKAFPNPVSDALNLQVTNASGGLVSIRNLLGIDVFQTSVDNSGTTRMNVGSLPPGFYIAVIETPHGIASISFQKI